VNVNRLMGKVAIVTGASSGIGRAIAVQYANEGAKVVVADLHEGPNQGGFEDATSATTVEEIGKNGGTAFFATCDVTRQQRGRSDAHGRSTVRNTRYHREQRGHLSVR
jgi:NAD(P)-dependent dehydrogenase (short-subunit alcohol dehydrogenase family)